MTLPPLDPPPRQARFRRGVGNLRRGYHSLFFLTILVLFGWAAQDAYRWSELSGDQRLRAIGFGIGAVLTLVVWRFVDYPPRRELRLARRGLVARGRVVEVRTPPRRRACSVLIYTLEVGGETRTGECKLPRSARAESLSPGTEIEVLYDPKDALVNRPRLALEFVEIGEAPRKK